MKRSNRILLVIGVVLAIVSFVAVLALGGFGQQPQTPALVDVTVVVAAADLPLGTQVTADKVTTATMPQREAEGTFQDPAQVVGKVVRSHVGQGAPLTTTDFESNTELPDVTASLTAGMRAIALPLSKTDSVGALLQPGDWVDVLISMEDLDQLNPVVVPNTGAPPTTGGTVDPYISLDGFVNNTTVKVVVQNVQVLAAMAKPVDDGSGDGSSSSSDQPDMVVLLAVSPQQAEVVRFAQLDGNVSLVLRSPADTAAPQVDTSGITLRQLVDEYGVLPPAPITPPTP